MDHVIGGLRRRHRRKLEEQEKSDGHGTSLAKPARPDHHVRMVLSAGILLWRDDAEGGAEVLLGHFGGPLWAKKDDGAWGLPKGVVEDGETPEQAARREFAEELGFPAEGNLVPLGRIRQKGG